MDKCYEPQFLKRKAGHWKVPLQLPSQSLSPPSQNQGSIPSMFFHTYFYANAKKSMFYIFLLLIQILTRLKAGGEGVDRGWDGRMALLTQWTWVWASSGSWWWAGKPGVLQSMGLQRVRHNWVTELNWTNCYHLKQSLEVNLKIKHI